MRPENRLRANADFERIRREGITLLHPLLVISLLPNQLDRSRFGFAVGRRIGIAVTRNRIRRRMREAVRLRLQAGGVVPGWDIVLIARRPVLKASFHEVDQAIGLLLSRAGAAKVS